MNHVLVNGQNEVVMLSAVAFDPVPAGFSAFETEEWPDPGLLRAEDGSFFQKPAPVPSVASALAARLDELAALRWQKEEAGTTAGGAPIPTDRITQAKLTAVYVRASSDPDYEVHWKSGPGEFVTLDATQIIAIGDAVTAHVQACFDREMELSAELVSASNAGNADAKRAAIAAVDISAGWPG